MTQNYKILNLHAENVKKLKVVDITPDPDNNIVTISGKNGQGKTSVLDSIYWALAGKDKIQGRPIRDGEEKAEITIDLGDYVIKRTFTDKNTYLTVQNKDGFKTSSPQVMLDNLMGSISFDPLAFTRMDGKKQYEELRSLVQLDVDIDELDKQSKIDFDERTIVNREVKNFVAQVDAIIVPEETPDEPINIKDLVQERDAKRSVINEHRELVSEIDTSLNQVNSINDQIEELQKRRDGIRADIDGKKTLLDAMVLPKQEIIDALNEQINNADKINEKVNLKQSKARLSAQLKAKQTEAERLTKNIDDRKSQKQKALEAAQFPVAGLSFDEGTVLFNDIPFDQASNAEQIRVSTAIAMASNPKIRVIRIKDGSLLDDQSMEALRSMAKEHDFQVWIEIVNSDDPVAVVIEDGEIKAE